MKSQQSGIYPKHFEKRIKIRDGIQVLLRPIKKTDVDLWVELYNSLSSESKYYRFFASRKEPTPDMVKKYTDIDYINNFSIVAIIKENSREKMIGVVRYCLDPPPNNAELAIVVVDEWQNKGLGTKMLLYILQIMIKRKIKKIHGDVFLDNQKMMQLMGESGFKLIKEDLYRVRHFEFNI